MTRKQIHASTLTAILALLTFIVITPMQATGQIGPDGFIGGSPTPLSEFSRQVVRGDVYVEGVGLRNVGVGSIDLAGNLPPGSFIKEAHLYWAGLRRGNEPLPSPPPITVNGFPTNSVYVATYGDPCWPTNDGINPPFAVGENFIDVYRNDVTGLIGLFSNNTQRFSFREYRRVVRLRVRPSSSQPLDVGDQFGSLVVEDFVAKPKSSDAPLSIRTPRSRGGSVRAHLSSSVLPFI